MPFHGFEEYDEDDFKYDPRFDGDSSVAISKKKLYEMREALRPKDAGASLIQQINDAKTPDEIMQILTDAGVPTTWNEQ